MRLEIVADVSAATSLLDAMEGRLTSTRPLMSMLAGEFAERQEEAFATSGFGEWAPLDPATVASKGSSRILVDTGSLLASLTGSSAADIDTDSVTFTTDHPAAPYLRRGTSRMPARDPIPDPTASEVDRWADHILGFVIDGRR